MAAKAFLTGDSDWLIDLSPRQHGPDNAGYLVGDRHGGEEGRLAFHEGPHPSAFVVPLVLALRMTDVAPTSRSFRR